MIFMAKETVRRLENKIRPYYENKGKVTHLRLSLDSKVLRHVVPACISRI